MRKGGKVGRVIDRPQNSARSTRNSFVLINATVAHIFYTMFSVRHKSFLLSGAAFLFLSFVLGQTIISQHMLNNRKEFFGMPVSSLSYFFRESSCATHSLKKKPVYLEKDFSRWLSQQGTHKEIQCLH